MSIFMKHFCTWTAAALWLGIAALCPAEETSGRYLTEDGRLKATLSLKNAQGGFVGFTGTIHTIRPSGEWTARQFINRQVREPHDKGTLTKAQLAQLAATLERYDLAGLPREVGGPPTVNPHLYTLTFGEQTATLVLGAGEPLPNALPRKPKTAAAARMVAIVRAIENLVRTKTGQ